MPATPTFARSRHLAPERERRRNSPVGAAGPRVLLVAGVVSGTCGAQPDPAKPLKPGEYVLDLKDTTMVLKNGRVAVESAVKVETLDKTYATTSVRYANGDGKYVVREIRLGGTKLKLVVD
jgi:hypothetical protein